MAVVSGGGAGEDVVMRESGVSDVVPQEGAVTGVWRRMGRKMPILEARQREAYRGAWCASMHA